MTRGRFISFEGGEGAGKSTVIHAVRERLNALGIHFESTREPGGTPLAEAIRALVLGAQWQGQVLAETELLLVFAARAQHVRERVIPMLDSGMWVLADRFTDASFAYQGGGRGQPLERIRELERWAACDLQPDLTFLLDVPVVTGLARAHARGERDRMELEQEAFFDRVRHAYLMRAAEFPERFRVIDASRSQIDVANAVLDELDRWLQQVLPQ
jgi:dTMP kinase